MIMTDVAELALRRVARPSRTGPEASPAHGVRGGSLGQLVDQEFEGPVVGHRPVDQDDRAALPLDPHRNGAAVLELDPPLLRHAFSVRRASFADKGERPPGSRRSGPYGGLGQPQPPWPYSGPPE